MWPHFLRAFLVCEISMYAVIDLETTGGQPSKDNIIEVAIRIHDGSRVIKRYESLVNPGRPIPPFITQLTGISDPMVKDAPRFYEIAREIVELTEGMIFVAHNVRFDYSFMKKEFTSLGFNYQRKTLCTVRLSRKLLPGLPSYSLGKLCHSLDIPLQNRHRAAGDAEATALLLDMILKKKSSEELDSFIGGEIKASMLPPQIKKDLVDELPEETGIYYFYDAAGRVIYVGKSTNIRKRVISHFTVDLKKKNVIEFKNSIADISYEVTGSELIALLHESDEIKKLKPVYNQALKRTDFGYGIFHFTDKNGYINFRVERLCEEKDPLLPLTNQMSAKNALLKFIDKYGLCEKHCGFDVKSKACFNVRLRKCDGACFGQEAPEDYNKKAMQVIQRFTFRQSNFLIMGPGRSHTEQSVVCIENGKYIGFGYINTDEHYDGIDALKYCLTPRTDNRDARQIIRSFYSKLPPSKIISY
jgi:DNA polymerase III subunit epsilon